MSAISHNGDHLPHKVCVKLSIEDLADIWYALDSVVQVIDALETNLHDLWFLVFASKDGRFNDCTELVRTKLKHALSTVCNDVMNKFEESLSELGEVDIIIRDHCERGRAQTLKNAV
jgi:hypothetical protein